MLVDTKKQFYSKFNSLCKEKTPFFFLIDYEMKKLVLCCLNELEANGIYLQTPDFTNFSPIKEEKKPLEWSFQPLSFASYLKQFEAVQCAIKAGDTYLLNLTCSTPINTNYSLHELANHGEAKHKLLYQDKFVHFSPEPFVQIKDGRIFSYPMKGTIDATLPGAAQLLRNDKKELNEQFTIVDLIRNDLSQVANNVKVSAFRYIEEIQTNRTKLLAMSSAIEGEIKPSFVHQYAELLLQLLPAGSITGAPKQKTKELIQTIETHHRNYYTGIWGIFDGAKIDSCVIIRYIEREGNNLHFKSGGGITHKSKAREEYEEMIKKIYVPIY